MNGNQAFQVLGWKKPTTKALEAVANTTTNNHLEPEGLTPEVQTSQEPFLLDTLGESAFFETAPDRYGLISCHNVELHTDSGYMGIHCVLWLVSASSNPTMIMENGEISDIPVGTILSLDYAVEHGVRFNAGQGYAFFIYFDYPSYCETVYEDLRLRLLTERSDNEYI